MRKLTQEEFIEGCKKVHGDKYDYSKVEYLGIDKDITIICKNHGEFSQNASCHKLQKQGCKKCADSTISARCNKGINKFIEEANIKHNNFYDYSKFIYRTAHTKGIIICPEHGEFEQRPNTHLSQVSGCMKCKRDSDGWSRTSWVNRAKIKVPKLYVVRLYNDNEDFIKVGITCKLRITDRLSQLPYNYDILLLQTNEAYKIWDLEHKIKKQLIKTYRYTPLNKFPGSCECYVKKSLKFIFKIIKNE